MALLCQATLTDELTTIQVSIVSAPLMYSPRTRKFHWNLLTGSVLSKQSDL